jgi:hypothetical protein
MTKMALAIGLLLLLATTAGAEAAGENRPLFDGMALSARLALRPGVSIGPAFTLVVPIARQTLAPLPARRIAEELLPVQLRERSFSEPSGFAGLQVALPNLRPLNLVVTADDLLNPICGLKLHLVW